MRQDLAQLVATWCWENEAPFFTGRKREDNCFGETLLSPLPPLIFAAIAAGKLPLSMAIQSASVLKFHQQNGHSWNGKEKQGTTIKKKQNKKLPPEASAMRNETKFINNTYFPEEREREWEKSNRKQKINQQVSWSLNKHTEGAHGGGREGGGESERKSWPEAAMKVIFICSPPSFPLFAQTGGSGRSESSEPLERET